MPDLQLCNFWWNCTAAAAECVKLDARWDSTAVQRMPLAAASLFAELDI